MRNSAEHWRHTMRTLIIMFCGTIGVASVGACTENVGSTEERAIVTEPNTPTFVVSGTIQQNEPHATFTPTVGSTPPTIVVAYNDQSLGSNNFLGWSFSTNGGSSWTKCDDTQASCGDGVSGVPKDTTNGQTDWRGDPTVVADGAGGVVYVTLADQSGNGNTAPLVVAAVSVDSGAHFTNTVTVNSDSNCNNGAQDQPTATFDMTTSPPKLTVAWRHNGSGTFGGCMRTGILCRAGDLDSRCPASRPSIGWDGNSESISNMGREDLAYGQGGFIVQAGNGNITIVYQNTDHIFNCPNTALKGLAWERVTTTDEGASWSSSSRILHTDNFSWCDVNGNSDVQNSLRAFGFVREPKTGDYYVAVNDAQRSVTVFRSTDVGATWSQIIQFASTAAGSRFFPTLAADTAGHVLLTDYESDSSDTSIRVVAQGAKSPSLATDWTQLNMTGFTLPEESGNTRTLGDYMGIAVGKPNADGVSSFFPAWIDVESNPASGLTLAQAKSTLVNVR